jgi:phosphinothricin acetyltransferase
MADYAVRSATLDDLQALTDIYNHYIVNTAITFDLQTFTAATRRGWFDDHSENGPHRLLVAIGSDGECLGYASSSRWRPKPAYNTTVETSVYCRPDAVGRGYGTALYSALLAALEREDIRTIVAGVSLPNPASLSFHEKFGFRAVGVFHAVGRKFDRFWDVAWFERPLQLELSTSERRTEACG